MVFVKVEMQKPDRVTLTIQRGKRYGHGRLTVLMTAGLAERFGERADIHLGSGADFGDLLIAPGTDRSIVRPKKHNADGTRSGKVYANQVIEERGDPHLSVAVDDWRWTDAGLVVPVPDDLIAEIKWPDDPDDDEPNEEEDK